MTPLRAMASNDLKAFIAAIPLVLGESYVVINFLLKAFIFGQVGVDLFDMVSYRLG